MSTAHPGTVMVDRYRLVQPAATDLAAAEAWEAHDQILDRPVRVTFVDGPYASAALDAARRAALVADPRLSRVLDVGSTDLGAGQRSYIISEPYRGSSLTEVVSGGLVDAQQARAVVGEAAAALEAAGQRGVHHLALRPEAVRVDGHRVVVTGLGIDAALAGVDGGRENITGSGAAAADARDLVALAYYTLTARWPGDSLDEPWIAPDAVRPLPAQRDAHGVVPVSTLVPHVDPELDTLVRRTFGTGTPDAPSTPGDVVAALAPWGEVSVVASLPQFVQPSTEPPVRSSVLGAVGAGAGLPGTPPPAPPVRRPSSGRIARSAGFGGVAGAAAGAAAGPTGAVPPQSTQAIPPVGAPSAAQAPVPPTQATAAMPPVQQSAPAPQAGAPTAAYGAAPAATYTNQAYPAPQAAPAQQQTAHAPVPPPPGGGEPRADTGGFASSPAPKRRGVNPTPIVLGLVVVLVLAGALWAVSQVMSPSAPPAAESPAATQEAGGGGGAAEQPSGEESSEPTETPEVRPVIKSGDQLDPEGEGQHPEAVDLAYDGDPSTFWYTQWFNGADFAGLRSGLGYVIELEEPAPVTSITLNTNSSGGHVEVRATSRDNPTDGPVLAEGSFSSETTLDLSEETVADSFVIWVTELPQTNDKYYVELNEIVLS
ncbi:protein kinase family protein [Krasilnikoviella flava]|uniref:Protein kinase domain-containing protein n=1 Tax=Krasilnikoviella flava TaxID=526729 RepID=A0A1T5KC08_9MICO|nr:hypothetical protein [Krasilnikoviella flava]SKC61272.1 hypothetical protein SAMN04324258_2057 [Krasilnikoviella flava]